MQALWMLLASLFFSAMSVCVKFAAIHFNTAELVCYRGAIGTLIMVVVCHRQGIDLKTPVPMMHLWRAVVGVVSLAGWFYAITDLPLATAMTLNYMSGIWVAAFLVGGTLLVGSLKDAARQGPVILTVLTGFAGVVMLLRPTFEQNQLFAGLIGLMSGMVAAMAYLQVVTLGRLGEPISRTVFYFSLGACLSGAVCLLFTGTSPWLWPQALWLLPIGVLAALGQFFMTRAYNDGATLVVANLQYAGIVFSALFGMVLFDDQIPWIGWAGMVLIIFSGIVATALRNRAMPNSPAEDH
ncbi:MAG: DMT family transporter [Burkholderiales bacterium]|nr:DMT family transporter [Burkholderiales bacterium]